MPKQKPKLPQTNEQGGMSLEEFNKGLSVLLTTPPPPVQRKFKPKSKPEPPKDQK